MGILDFLFGKSPDIFDEKGVIRHDLPKTKWDKWSNRYTSDPEYNWRNHTGIKGKDRKSNTRNPAH